MMNSTLLLSTAYFAPIQYYTKLFANDSVWIEQFEHYSKQSFRNRCDLLAANGPLSLSIPIKKETQAKVLTKDVRIDYDLPWQRMHWKSIESAYRHSPFYEYYIDSFERFFHNRYEFLLDLNLEIQSQMLLELDVECQFELTTDYCPSSQFEGTDLRDAIHPKPCFKQEDPNFQAEAYYQVFGDRFGFTPNLSILDLLFNEGPCAINILDQSFLRTEAVRT